MLSPSKKDEEDMHGEKILLRRRVTLQRVQLPNGQTFLAKYERTSRRNLPRKKRRQKGGGLLTTLAKLGTRLGTKALSSTGLLKKGSALE